jgi:hypothetical protein
MKRGKIPYHSGIPPLFLREFFGNSPVYPLEFPKDSRRTGEAGTAQYGTNMPDISWKLPSK